jgi:uncharacterized protein
MSSNRQIVADAFAAWSAGTGYVTSIFAPDMRWEIVGRSAVSKRYDSAQQFVNTYAWFMTLDDGKVIDGTAFYDSIAFNELWETVSPGG